MTIRYLIIASYAAKRDLTLNWNSVIMQNYAKLLRHTRLKSILDLYKSLEISIFAASKEWAHIRAGIVKIWRCEPHKIPFCRSYAQHAHYQKYAIIASASKW